MARQQRPTRAAGAVDRVVATDTSRLDAAQFWQQALEIYQEPGMQKALLARQNKQQQNVNLNLLAIVLERQGAPLDDGHYAALEAVVEPFSSAHTKRLRDLRQLLSHSPSLPEKSRQQLKEQLLAAELILEAEEQQLLLNTYHQLMAHR